MKALIPLLVFSIAVMTTAAIKGVPIYGSFFSDSFTHNDLLRPPSFSWLNSYGVNSTEVDDLGALHDGPLASLRRLESVSGGVEKRAPTPLALQATNKVGIPEPDEYLPLKNMSPGSVVIGQYIDDPEGFLPRGSLGFTSEGKVGLRIDTPSTYLPLNGVPAANQLVGEFIGDPDFYLPKAREHFATEKHGEALEDNQGLSP